MTGQTEGRENWPFKPNRDSDGDGQWVVKDCEGAWWNLFFFFFDVFVS